MGRHAKYFTVVEAAAGCCERKRRHNQSLCGKQVRIAARSARNSRKGARNNSKASNPPPSLSATRADASLALLDPKIMEWHVFPLPDEEELFLDTLNGERGRDFSCLEIWMVEPPFADDDDPQTLHYIGFTHNSQVALHGLRLRQEQADDARLRAAFAAGVCTGGGAPGRIARAAGALDPGDGAPGVPSKFTQVRYVDSLLKLARAYHLSFVPLRILE
ncbi:hypothetical protein B0H13DRAFT_2323513 [Mycena leptocephala]|nr:hypothetical protein B0H13DRAFT_2323513 [Mycena leptocephala]